MNEPGLLKRLENRLYALWHATKGKRPGRKGKDVNWGATRPGRDDDYPTG